MRQRPTGEQIIRNLIREFNEPTSITRWSQLIPLMLLADKDVDQEDDESDILPVAGSRPSDASLDAVVIGDSQAGGALGNTIKSRLEEMGYAVRKTHENGASGE